MTTTVLGEGGGEGGGGGVHVHIHCHGGGGCGQGGDYYGRREPAFVPTLPGLWPLPPLSWGGVPLYYGGGGSCVPPPPSPLCRYVP
jgi:hypothetical protein